MKKAMIILLWCLVLCCLFCGCQKEECSHQFTSVTVTEASCREAGILKHTCQLCGISVTQTTAAAHHVFSESLTREATCTQEGIITHTCTSCGTTEDKSVPLADHQFDLYSLNPSCCTACGNTVEGAAADPHNPWYGKNWVALGTSLTSEAQGKFAAPLAERSGLVVTNLGVPGGTAVAHVLQNVQTAAIAHADLVTVEFGVNDWFEGVPLGTVGDTVPYLATIDQWTNGGTESGTFAGACYQIFKGLQERAPNAVIVFLSDPTGHTVIDAADCTREKTNYIGLRQRDYTEMALAVARYMGIRSIDAGSMSMINQEHPQYLADQIHHSELGGKQYALTVWMELKDIAPLLKAE